jgi:hypothetical protein
MPVRFDTLEFAQHLRASGIAQDHAEGHAAAVQKILLLDVASRGDLSADLAQLRAELKAFEESLINRVTKLVVAILVGTLSAVGLLVALFANIGKLFGH